MIRNLTTVAKSRLMAAALSAAVLGAVPSTSLAEHWGNDRGPAPAYRGRVESRDGYDNRNDRRDDHGGGRIDIHLGGPTWDRPPVIEERTAQVWVEPVYRTVSERVWVPAEYRTVTDRVWREPVVQRVRQNVWVPDRYEDRDIGRWEHGRRVIVRERVLVAPGHYELRNCDVVVVPGHYEDITRQELVCDGHWAMVNREELICPGHWETRVERVAVGPRHDDSARIDLKIPIRW